MNAQRDVMVSYNFGTFVHGYVQINEQGIL